MRSLTKVRLFKELSHVVSERVDDVMQSYVLILLDFYFVVKKDLKRGLGVLLVNERVEQTINFEQVKGFSRLVD